MKTLALQGGGCLGKGQAVALVELERQAARPLGEIFGLIGGTSVGAIIGGAIAGGIPMARVDQFFDREAPVIFADDFLKRMRQLFWGPKYSARPLEAALQSLLDERTLADCRTHFIATAYDFTRDRLVFFKSYEPSSENDNIVVIGRDSGIKLWQVLRASAAAQTYFPAYRYRDLVLLDGGNTGDNAPDQLVFTEAGELSAGGGFTMLSVGSGNTKWSVNPRSMFRPGEICAGIKTIDIIFSAGETNAVLLTRKNLGKNYYRLVADLGAGYAMDDASPAAFAGMTAAWQAAIRDNPAIFREFSAQGFPVKNGRAGF